MRDTRFFYEFTSYVGTPDPPLRIWNMRRGRAVDVSAEPRFRSAYLRDLDGRRAGCLQAGDAAASDCPAYVATAARLGRFRSAWHDMLRVYDHARDDAPVGERFPHHLRRFLRANGYLRA